MKVKVTLFSILLTAALFPQPNVLILEDGGTEDSVYAILNRTGTFNLTLGGPYYLYTGQNINQYNVIIFLNGIDWQYTMADSVQQKIVTRVSQGAGLFTIEWITWNTVYPIVENILPVTTDATYTEHTTETLTKVALTHPIGTGLPNTFLLPGLHSFTLEIRDTNPSKQAVTVFQGSWSNSAITAGVWGSGKTVHWSSAGHYSSNNIWDNNTRTLLVNIIRYLAGLPVGINLRNEIAGDYFLYQNYPNPFNPLTNIRFNIPLLQGESEGQGEFVKLAVFDVLGREITTLVNEHLNAGSYEVKWSAENYSSGVYYYRIDAGGFSDIKKMILIK